jgi:hypothetical protein
MNLNEYYIKFELTQTGAKKLNQLVQESNVIVINDFDSFEKYSNLEALKGIKKKNPQKPENPNPTNRFPLKWSV